MENRTTNVLGPVSAIVKEIAGYLLLGIVIVAFLILFGLLFGCAGFQHKLPTRCPQCGWFITCTWHGTIDGQDVRDFACNTDTCGWSGSYTNAWVK